MRRIFLVIFILVTLALLPGSRAQAAPDCLLATHTVTSTADSGAGTLRDILPSICPGDTISLDGVGQDGVITLTSGYIGINMEVTIEATPGMNIAISTANGAPSSGDHRIFRITGGPVMLRGFTIRDGVAYDEEGGALYTSADLSLEQMLFENNWATWGGGAVRVSGSNLTVSASRFTSNTTTSTTGAAIYSDGNILNISDSLFTQNASLSSGSAILASPSVVGQIRNTTFSGNTGGYPALDVRGTMTAEHITVTNHNGTTAISVESGATLNLNNSIVGGNSASANCRTFGTIIATNSIADDATCGSTTVVADVMLEPLADNGGLYETHLPQVGSPAINAGDSAVCANVNGFDQRGSPRFNGSGSMACDLGAVEFQNTDTGSISEVGYTADFFNHPTLGNMLVITDTGGALPFNITITRTNIAPGGSPLDDANLQFRIWAVNDTGLDVTLKACYTDSEVSNFYEPDLVFYRYNDNTNTWNLMGSSNNDAANNCASLNNVSGFSAWTFASSDFPATAVQMQAAQARPLSFWARLWQWWLGWFKF